MGDGAGEGEGHGYVADMHPIPHLREASDRTCRPRIAHSLQHSTKLPWAIHEYLPPPIRFRRCKIRGSFDVSGTPKDWSAQHWAYAKVMEIFGADLRSLATFRIVLALLVLSDLANRATDLSAHYTDAGIMPRTVLVEQVLSHWAFSLHLMNGGALFQALLFGVAAFAALGMLNGSESPVLRMLVFWGMLLPLGAYWSVDRTRSALPRPSPRFLSLATFGLFMQIAFVYWFSAALKSGP